MMMKVPMLQRVHDYIIDYVYNTIAALDPYISDNYNVFKFRPHTTLNAESVNYGGTICMSSLGFGIIVSLFLVIFTASGVVVCMQCVKHHRNAISELVK
jgi:hypothetical protein